MVQAASAIYFTTPLQLQMQLRTSRAIPLLPDNSPPPRRSRPAVPRRRLAAGWTDAGVEIARLCFPRASDRFAHFCRLGRSTSSACAVASIPVASRQLRRCARDRTAYVPSNPRRKCSTSSRFACHLVCHPPGIPRHTYQPGSTPATHPTGNFTFDLASLHRTRAAHSKTFCGLPALIVPARHHTQAGRKLTKNRNAPVR